MAHIKLQLKVLFGSILLVQFAKTTDMTAHALTKLLTADKFTSVSSIIP
jgi:hypothetical protein